MAGVRPTVTASTMIARFDFGRKVRCHKGVVENLRPRIRRGFPSSHSAISLRMDKTNVKLSLRSQRVCWVHRCRATRRQETRRHRREPQ